MADVKSGMDEIQLYIVNEYVFENKEDYNAALQEKKGIKYLNSQLDLNNVLKVKDLYNELIEKHVFRTPIGIDYLKLLRHAVLQKKPDLAAELKQIPIHSDNHKKANELDRYVSNRAESQIQEMEAKIKKTKERSRISVILNFVMAATVIAMIAITLFSSNNTTILNYERVLQDKYAGWAQELSAKEEKLRKQQNEIDKILKELEEHTSTTVDENQ